MLAAAAEAAVPGEAVVVKRDEFPFFSFWTKADTAAYACSVICPISQLRCFYLCGMERKHSK